MFETVQNSQRFSRSLKLPSSWMKLKITLMLSKLLYIMPKKQNKKYYLWNTDDLKFDLTIFHKIPVEHKVGKHGLLTLTWVTSKCCRLYHRFTLRTVHICWWWLDTTISTTITTRPALVQFLLDTVMLRPRTFLFNCGNHLIGLLVIVWILWNEWV